MTSGSPVSTDTIGPYRLLRKLGEGGMGTVWAAEDTRLGRDVAIKVIRRGSDANANERLWREARSIASVSHPNVCQVFDVGEHAGDVYVAMELLEGESLQDAIGRGPISLPEAVDTMLQVLNALNALHEKHIVHRDLKPSNIMLTRHGAKLLDFGLALPLDHDTARLTTPGTFVGTPRYVAPEQWDGAQPTPASDIFACGAVLYEMLAARPAFEGESIVTIAKSIANHEPPPLQGGSTMRAADHVIRRAIAKSPAERYDSPASMAWSLQCIWSSDEPTVSVHPPPLASPAAMEEPRHVTGPFAFASSGSAKKRTAVAVLPFANLTADVENEYFADGIAEDLLNELSKLSALKVVSRTSAAQFKKRDQSLGEIGRTLKADMLVEGSVRRAGDRVRVAVRVVNVETDEQVWTDVYDRMLTDIFAVQTEIAQQVVAALAPELSSSERQKVGQPATTDVDAYQLYLQGRHCSNRATEQGFRQALDFFERAIARAPEYARPYYGIGFVYMALGIGGGAGTVQPAEARAKSKQAIERAIALDPTLAAAHGVDACLKFMFDFDWEGSEHSFRKALELSPDDADLLDQYGLFLASLERFDEAVAAQRRAQELDPLVPVFVSDTASTLLRARRYDEAMAMSRKLLALEPTFVRAHSTLGWGLILTGQIEEGLHELEASVSLSPGTTMFEAQLAQAYAMAGRAGRAHEVLDRLLALSSERYVSPYHLAYVYTGLREFDRAIDLLEEAVELRAGGVYGIRGSFLFRDLLGHPRFTAVLRKMNLA